MKVVHIITGLGDGGAEGVLFRLVTSDFSGVEHVVISLMDDGKYGGRLRALGVEVVTLNMPGGKLRLGALWTLYSILKRSKPDAVQTWMYHADLVGGVIARLSGCNNIFWGIRHSNLSSDTNSRSTLIVAKLCALVSPWVPKKIISCAEKSVGVHQAIGYKGDFIVIPNGFDTSLYSPSTIECEKTRKELHLEPGAVVVGFVARWDPQKDHKNLLIALQRIKKNRPNIICLFIGAGCDRENEELIANVNALELGANIMLLGPRNDIPAVMNSMDIHVLSSSCGEAFPNVVAEAMASGTPCVVTDVGDASEIVGDVGWVVSTRDSDCLANAMELAFEEMKSPRIWQERKLKCVKRVNDLFSLERMVKSFEKAWFSE